MQKCPRPLGVKSLADACAWSSCAHTGGDTLAKWLYDLSWVPPANTVRSVTVTVPPLRIAPSPRISFAPCRCMCVVPPRKPRVASRRRARCTPCAGSLRASQPPSPTASSTLCTWTRATTTPVSRQTWRRSGPRCDLVFCRCVWLRCPLNNLGEALWCCGVFPCCWVSITQLCTRHSYFAGSFFHCFTAHAKSA